LVAVADRAEHRSHTIELSQYFRILRTHWLALILLAALGAGAAWGWAALQPPVYSANASGIVQAGGSSDLGTALAGDNYAQSRVKSYLDLAQSRAVAASAIAELGLDDAPEALVQRVTTTNPIDTAVVKVTAEAGSAEAARDLAEAWMRGLIAAVDELETSGTGTKTTTIVSLVPIDSAVLPTSPSWPNYRLVVALGLIAGLAIGIAYAVLRNQLDRRIRSTEVIDREFGLPVVGEIPIEKSFTETNRIAATDALVDYHAYASDATAVAEAMRELRTNLQFMDVDDPPRVIVVTSSLPGEGKSTVTANLAVAIAASGQRVIVVDGDLRRPMVATSFGLLPGVGLTDVLVGRAELDDVLQPWGDSGNLFILGAGATPPNPSELLGSRSMQKLLEQMSQDAIVLIDAPPLIPVTDAVILTARTDGALVVASVGSTTVDSLQRGLANLERANARVLGVILNRVPRSGSKGHYYGYKPTYALRTAPDPTTTHSP
jgi:capsular exopolysaccharide synthesis family protein